MNKKMNYLFITSDQQRWDTIHANNPLIKTPNIDRLCEKGISFNRGYTPNPVCTPSRISMLTGHYPSKHGCYTIGTGLPQDYPTIPNIMSENGYFTSLIGKAHFQPCLFSESFESEPNIFDREFFKEWTGPYYGFDYVKLVIGHSVEKHSAGMHYGVWLKENGIDITKYFGNNQYTDFGTWELPQEYSGSKWTADETIGAIDKALEKDENFFIWSSFQDPHNPCFVPEPWASMYKEEDMPVYNYIEGEMDNKPLFYKEMVEKGSFRDTLEIPEKNWHCVRNLPFMNEAEKRRIMALYYGMVSQMDHYIGKILDYLEEKNLMDNTIIIFTSDHGDYMGNHGLWWKGLPAYEDAQRVPFVVAHPQCKTPGTKSDALQSLVDIGNTFLAVSDIELPVGLQGVNQEASWIDSNVSTRDWAMVEFRPTENQYMQKTFITNEYKLVVYHNRKYGELYNLISDPQQYNNLWDNPEYRDIRDELMQRLISAEMEKEGILRERVSMA